MGGTAEGTPASDRVRVPLSSHTAARPRETLLVRKPDQEPQPAGTSRASPQGPLNATDQPQRLPGVSSRHICDALISGRRAGRRRAAPYRWKVRGAVGGGRHRIGRSCSSRGQCYPSPEREPHIFHPLRVMLSLANPADQIVPALHDAVEDTDGTSEAWQSWAIGLSAPKKCSTMRRQSGSFRMYSGAWPPGVTSAT